MNAADIGGGAGNAVTLNQNLNQHQFHQGGGGGAASKAGMASRLIGGGAEAEGIASTIGTVARLAPLLLV